MWAFKYEVIFTILSGVVFFYFLEYTIGKNEGDELENKNKEDKIIEAIRKFAIERKILFALSVILIFGFLIPLIIDFAYFIGRYLPSIEAPWDASDVFVFYGTLLSAAATIIAVTWTINFNRKSAELDRNNQTVINNRNLIIKAGSDFIESINYQKTTVEILKIVLIKNKKLDFADIELIREKLMFIIAESNTTFAKYQMFSNDQNVSVFAELGMYKNKYHEDIENFEKILIEIREILKVPSDYQLPGKAAYLTKEKQLETMLKEFTEKYTIKYPSALDLIKRSIPE